MKTTIGIISDIHVSPAGTPPASWHNPYPLAQAREMLRTAIARCAAANVDAVVLLGDLAHTGDLESVAAVISETTSLSCPVHVLPGNHDTVHPPEALHETITSNGGTTLTVAPAAVAIADDLHVVTMTLEHDRAAGTMRGKELPEAAADAGALVVFTHFPLLETQFRVTLRDFLHAGDLHNRKELESAIASRTAPAIVVHGHLHVRDAHARGPILQLGCGALIEPPHEVTVLEISHDGGEAISVTRRAESVADHASTERLPVFVPDVQTWRYAGGAWTSDPA